MFVRCLIDETECKEYEEAVITKRGNSWWNMLVVSQIISSLLCLSGTVSVEIKLWCSTSSSLSDANQLALCWLCNQFFFLKSGGEKGFLGSFECRNKNSFWLANYLKWQATSLHWTRPFFFTTMALSLLNLIKCMWTQEHYTNMYIYELTLWPLKVFRFYVKKMFFTEEFTHKYSGKSPNVQPPCSKKYAVICTSVYLWLNLSIVYSLYP